MAFISVSGTGCAAPTPGLDGSTIGAVQKFLRRLGVAMLVVAALPALAPGDDADRTPAAASAAPLPPIELI